MTTLARVAFALLVAATFAAFFVAQQLKSAPSFINRVDVVEHFSPVCGCPQAVQTLTFRLKESDDVTVDVVDLEGARVARVATARPVRAFEEVELQWRGIADNGRRAPDGRYRFRFGLRRLGRSIVYRESFLLDTRPPAPRVVRTSGGIVSPGQPVDLRISGANREALATVDVLRTDDGEPRRIRTFEGVPGGRATWDGRDDQGRPAEPGTYLLQLSVADRAGNVGVHPGAPLVPDRVRGVPGVVVRGIAVQPPAKAVAAGRLASFRVDARGRSYRWSIRRVGEPRPRKRSGRRKTTTIVATRAPGGVSGAYIFEARAGRYSAQVPFAVQSAERSPLLVVLPAIHWLGTNELDGTRRPDGVPDALANGSSVPYPRIFPGEDGLPDGFADEVAPLLVMLDRARIRYDLTTDVALSLGEGPRAKDRPGVLFAGPSRWISRPLARRLRAYVQEGGRLALFGPGGLRAGVEVGPGELTNPTPPGPSDALGARLADLRRLEGDPPPELAQLEDAPRTLRVFEGWDGFIGGFERVEELIAPGDGAEVVAGIGQLVTEAEVLEAQEEGRDPREERPALSAVAQGDGYVFRVGIEGWVRRIAEGDADVVQITRNVVDLLRRVTPRPRSGLR